MKNKTKEFIEKARQVHRSKYNYSKVKYINNHTKVCIICPEHGEFWQTPNNHLQGKGCPKCRYISSSQKLSLTKEEFVKKAKQIYGDKYDYSKVEYVNFKTKVCIICPEHGEFWQTPNNFLNNHACQKCGEISRRKKQSLTKEEFIKKAKQVHGDKYDYSKVEYINNHTKICIICSEHGEFWMTSDAHIGQKQGCNKCKHSKLEDIVYKFLFKNNIKFETQKKFNWLKYKKSLRLDFYLPDYNIAIECQGIQHFEPVEYFGGKERFNENIKRDLQKKELCQQHGIKIVYITKKNKENLKNIIYENI